MNIHYKFDSSKVYILACSFGPDSMALFDIIFKLKCRFIVAFVNYHKREISNYEQEMIFDYCQKRNIKCEILDVKRKIKKDFQNQARQIRYNFFKKIYKKYNAAGLLVAHQQDDLIETYIMQKNKKNRVENYGIKNISSLKGMKIIRPLLKYSKEKILNYCHTNNVPFSIDETNCKLNYLRNKIRHSFVINLTKEKRNDIVHQINMENKKIILFRKNLNKKINPYQSKLNIKQLIVLNKKEFGEAIIQFTSFNLKKVKQHVDISIGYINEIYKICLSKKKNIAIPLIKKFFLFKEYDQIIFRNCNNKNNNYFYIIKNSCKLITNDFIIDLHKKSLFDNKDYPIIVRPVCYNDKIKIGNFYLKINRLFINWKLPIYFRKIWPVFCNLKNEILYVPRYKNSSMNKSNLKIRINVIKNVKKI